MTLPAHVTEKERECGVFNCIRIKSPFFISKLIFNPRPFSLLNNIKQSSDDDDGYKGQARRLRELRASSYVPG